MTDMVLPIQAAHDAKDAVVAAAEAKKRFEDDVWVEGFAGDFVVAALEAALPHLRPLFETATKVALELGRKEALTEVKDWIGKQQHKRATTVTKWSAYMDVAAEISRLAAREIGSKEAGE